MHTYKVNDTAKFLKYVELDPKEPPILTEGDDLIIVEVIDHESYKVRKTNIPKGGKQVFDSIYFDEMEPSEASTQVVEPPVEESVKEPAKKAAKKAAKKVVAKVEEPQSEEAEEPVKEPAKKAAKKVAKKVNGSAKPELAAKATIFKPGDDTGYVKNVLKGSKQQILASAKSMVEEVEQTYFHLGGVLNAIHKDQTFLELAGPDGKTLYDGDAGFAKYTKSELGYDYRKVMYLIKIYTHFTSIGVDTERLAKIGWSKAKELVGVTTADNFDEYADYAENHSRNELQSYIKETTTKGSSGDGQGTTKTTFVFKLFEDKGKVLNEALDLAIKSGGASDIDEALDLIVTEWLSVNNYSQPTLEQAKSALEKRFGVELEVYETEEETEEGLTEA